MPRLEANAVHLWLTQPDQLVAAGRLDQCSQLLDEPERGRVARFHRQQDRVLYTVSHALLRTALAHYSGVAAPALRFESGPYGKPFITEPAEARGLQFNLSHTQGLAACAITLDRTVGVDVEFHGRNVDPLELSADHFAPVETAALQALRPPARLELFYRLWTLKEAYLKARGAGLRLPLRHCQFQLPPQGLTVSFEPELQERIGNWAFALLDPFSDYSAALCVARGEATSSPVALTCYEFLAPLQEPTRLSCAGRAAGLQLPLDAKPTT